MADGKLSVCTLTAMVVQNLHQVTIWNFFRSCTGDEIRLTWEISNGSTDTHGARPCGGVLRSLSCKNPFKEA